jgi:hypothetical protein
VVCITRLSLLKTKSEFPDKTLAPMAAASFFVADATKWRPAQKRYSGQREKASNKKLTLAFRCNQIASEKNKLPCEAVNGFLKIIRVFVKKFIFCGTSLRLRNYPAFYYLCKLHSS